MKKGYIAGKGYIRPHRALCDGGGRRQHGHWRPTFDPVMVSRISNPGAVRMSLGGVGRNIAHNMRLVGPGCRGSLTAFGDDLERPEDRRQLRRAGHRHLAQSLDRFRGDAPPLTSSSPTSKGDMALAVSDMEIYRHLTPRMLCCSGRQLLSGQPALVVHATPTSPRRALQWLAENCRSAPLCRPGLHRQGGESASRCWAGSTPSSPTAIEAELLSGVAITDEASLTAAADAAAGHRAAAGVHLPGAETACLPPTRPEAAPSACPAGGDGERHRLRRRLYGGHRLGLSSGHRPGGHRHGRAWPPPPLPWRSRGPSTLP